MASTSHALSLFLLLSAASSMSPAVRADDAGNQLQGLTHIHLYMHETFSGPNATIVTSVPPPFPANSTFGRIVVVDNELRTGPDRASSQLVGRIQALVVSAGLKPDSGFQTSVTYVFTAGEYNGSMLSVQGSAPSFAEPFERAVVGGTGRFRLARGYALTKIVDNPTPESSVYQMDLFVLTY